ALNDLSGGLINPPPAGGEPSGRDLDRETPHDAVLDPPDSSLQALGALFPGCHAGEETPSEFRRPWLWPAKDNQGDPVPSEFSLAPASPYHSTQNATVLMTSSPGDNPTRSDFEHAKNEQDTIKIASSHLPQGKHLGDPVDYTSYVVAQLTRKQPGTIANFNL